MQQILLGSMEYLKAGIIMNTPMTGEPRQLTTPNIALSADTPPPSARDADMPVFAVNTDGVIRTTSEKTLAPLFTQHAATDFRSRCDS